ncbi:hypothetical protein MZK49_15590 [Ensifer sesbaniae]|uniref:hypothetical protein n=1 Tax=Ensifer sesbaniae TaxID=1214071 RepID=UPI001569C9FC|nr:hypothetical protein [Ensifer sesbaniae]MCK3778127.1 hypothetical protein [Ensifer sesbaniae]NRQ17794.1 hypothetical protein [Ensifer sesbaniae]
MADACGFFFGAAALFLGINGRRAITGRQVAKLSQKGRLKISVAVSVPLIAKVEVSYQCDFNAKADNDNEPK